MSRRNERRLRQPAVNRKKGSAKNKFNSCSQPTIVYFGTNRPSASVLPGLLFGIFMSPLLFIGGVLCGWAMDPRKQQGSFWLLPLLQMVAGIAFIGLWFYVIWKQCIWQPGITITRFRLADRRLLLCTPSTREIEIALDDVKKFYRQPSDHGTAGWWIQLPNKRWLYLQNDWDKAPQLAARFDL